MKLLNTNQPQPVTDSAATNPESQATSSASKESNTTPQIQHGQTTNTTSVAARSVTQPQSTQAPILTAPADHIAISTEEYSKITRQAAGFNGLTNVMNGLVNTSGTSLPANTVREMLSVMLQNQHNEQGNITETSFNVQQEENDILPTKKNDNSNDFDDFEELERQMTIAAHHEVQLEKIDKILQEESKTNKSDDFEDVKAEFKTLYEKITSTEPIGDSIFAKIPNILQGIANLVDTEKKAPVLDAKNAITGYTYTPFHLVEKQKSTPKTMNQTKKKKSEKDRSTDIVRKKENKKKQRATLAKRQPSTASHDNPHSTYEAVARKKVALINKKNKVTFTSRKQKDEVERMLRKINTLQTKTLGQFTSQNVNELEKTIDAANAFLDSSEKARKTTSKSPAPKRKSTRDAAKVAKQVADAPTNPPEKKETPSSQLKKVKVNIAETISKTDDTSSFIRGATTRRTYTQTKRAGSASTGRQQPTASHDNPHSTYEAVARKKVALTKKKNKVTFTSTKQKDEFERMLRKINTLQTKTLGQFTSQNVNELEKTIDAANAFLDSLEKTRKSTPKSPAPKRKSTRDAAKLAKQVASKMTDAPTNPPEKKKTSVNESSQAQKVKADTAKTISKAGDASSFERNTITRGAYTKNARSASTKRKLSPAGNSNDVRSTYDAVKRKKVTLEKECKKAKGITWQQKAVLEDKLKAIHQLNIQASEIYGLDNIKKLENEINKTQVYLDSLKK